MYLNVATYNCNSVRNNFAIVKTLLEDHDIVLLQETILTDDNLNFLNTLDDNFNYAAVPSTCNNSNNFCGRASGGLAIYWSKTLSSIVRPIFYNNRIMGLKIINDNNVFLILNVYLPCDYRTNESLTSFRTTLAEISDILESEDVSDVIIAGDFNCDPNKGRFFTEFSNLIQTYHLHAVDLDLSQDNFTYISAGQNCATSWLDHIVASKKSNVKNVDIMYGLTLFDHIPVQFNIILSNLEVGPILNNPIKQNSTFILWDKASENDIAHYKLTLDSLVKNYLCNAFMCNEVKCDNVNHKNHLNDA
jgi:hypothetical protein